MRFPLCGIAGPECNVSQYTEEDFGCILQANIMRHSHYQLAMVAF